jgi:hypothetical protein
MSELFNKLFEVLIIKEPVFFALACIAVLTLIVTIYLYRPKKAGKTSH